MRLGGDGVKLTEIAGRVGGDRDAEQLDCWRFAEASGVVACLLCGLEVGRRTRSFY